jgi:hypothetical protein
MISNWKQELVKRAGELFARGSKAPAAEDAQKVMQDRMNLISGNGETSSRLPALAYSPRKLSKRPAPSQSYHLSWSAHLVAAAGLVSRPLL